jgi:ribonuclease HI
MDGGNELLIYTDGACIPNPGRGGWGVVILQPSGELRKFSGSAQEKTTSSRMEMTAVLMALRKLSASGVPVTIRIDSEFVVLTLHGKYRQKKNKDLWIEINRERSRLLSRLIHFEWVKGHADDPHNAMADELANTAAGSRAGGYAEPAHLAQVKKGLKCNECSEPMRPFEPHAAARAVGQQWFRCDQCKRSAFKDARGAHYIPVKISAGPGRDPADNPLAITAPLDPALRGPTNWRRKFRRPK